MEKIYIFVSVYSTYYGMGLNRPSTSTKKIYSFLITVILWYMVLGTWYHVLGTWYMVLGKNEIRLNPQKKKFWLQCYYGTWDKCHYLRVPKIIGTLSPPKKIYVSSFRSYSDLIVISSESDASITTPILLEGGHRP